MTDNIHRMPVPTRIAIPRIPLPPLRIIGDSILYSLYNRVQYTLFAHSIRTPYSHDPPNPPGRCK